MSPPVRGRRPFKTYGRNIRARIPIFIDQETISGEDMKAERDGLRKISPPSTDLSTKPPTPLQTEMQKEKEDVTAPHDFTRTLKVFKGISNSKPSKRTALSSKTANAIIVSLVNPTTPAFNKVQPVPTSPPRKKRNKRATYNQAATPLERRSRRIIEFPSLQAQDSPNLLTTPKSKSPTRLLSSVDTGNASSIARNSAFHQRLLKFSGAEEQLSASPIPSLANNSMERAKGDVNDTTEITTKSLPTLTSPKTPKKVRPQVISGRKAICMGLNSPSQRLSTPRRSTCNEVIECTDEETEKLNTVKPCEKHIPSSRTFFAGIINVQNDSRRMPASAHGVKEKTYDGDNQGIFFETNGETMLHDEDTITVGLVVPRGKSCRIPKTPMKTEMVEEKSREYSRVKKHEIGSDADAEMCTEDDNNSDLEVSTDDCGSVKHRNGTTQKAGNKAGNKAGKELNSDPIYHDFDFDPEYDNKLQRSLHDKVIANDNPIGKKQAVAEAGAHWGARAPEHKRLTKITKEKHSIMENSSDELASNRYSIVTPPIKAISPDRKSEFTHNNNRRAKKARLMTAAEKVTNNLFNLTYQEETMEIDELQWNIPEYHV